MNPPSALLLTSPSNHNTINTIAIVHNISFVSGRDQPAARFFAAVIRPPLPFFAIVFLSFVAAV